MAFTIREINNDGHVVELGERLEGEGPFNSRQEAEARVAQLESVDTNRKFTVFDLRGHI